MKRFAKPHPAPFRRKNLSTLVGQKSKGIQPNEVESLLKNHRVAVGHHAIFEILKVHRKQVKFAWLKQDWRDSQDLREIGETLTAGKIQIVEKPDAVLSRVASSHQGCAVFLQGAPEIDLSLIVTKPISTMMVLDGLEDPQNLGAILRTSWLMGVDGIYCSEHRSVRLSPSVHKIASGGVEHVPVEFHSQFNSKIAELKEHGFWVYGLSHKARTSIYDLKINEKAIWCIGSEESGLRTSTERICDELVSVPQLDAAASYNASVVAAIALSENMRQRRFNKS